MTGRSSASLRAESYFRVRLAELGTTPLYLEWRGVMEKHKVRCQFGHESWPRPNDVQQGHGPCRTCSGKNPAVAEAKFRAKVTALGGTSLYTKWHGTFAKHRIQCAAGHIRLVRPNDVIRQGRGICGACATNDPIVAEATFRKLLAAAGATPSYSKWLGNKKPHSVRCAYGHECSPQPNHVQSGQGVCRICGGCAWDVFYIVTNPANARVKFGITSHDGRSRLGRHRRAGYTDVRFVGKVGGADVLEHEVIDTLAAHNVQPVRGREYFDLDLALPYILQVVDGWLADGRLLAA